MKHFWSILLTVILFALFFAGPFFIFGSIFATAPINLYLVEPLTSGLAKETSSFISICVGISPLFFLLLLPAKLIHTKVPIYQYAIALLLMSKVAYELLAN